MFYAIEHRQFFYMRLNSIYYDNMDERTVPITGLSGSFGLRLAEVASDISSSLRRSFVPALYSWQNNPRKSL